MAQPENNYIDVLDEKGYVRLVDYMGSDLSVVNSARVSYAKESKELTEKDLRLISFLAKNEHTSPFRHATLQFEIYAPLMVARHWWKHVVGGSHQQDAWNESSRRYVTEIPMFYVPDSNEWRLQGENKKQGSSKDTLGEIKGSWYSLKLMEQIDKGLELYEKAMADGVCAEQARLFLPAYGMYVRWYWTSSLQSVCHFLTLRQDSHAQHEIQQYANAVYALSRPLFPISIDEIVKKTA